MGALERFAPPPPAAISRVLSTFDRAALEGFIAVAIDLLDLAEPDPDAEEIGLEDSFMEHPGDGAGCPVADSAGDQAWIEWTTMRGSQKGGPAPSPGNEDAEEDDEAEEDDDDTAVDDKPCDGQHEDQEPEEGIFPGEYGVDQTKGLQHGLGDGDRAIMGPHRDRIRRESCDRVGTSFWGAPEWRLRDRPE